MKKRLLPAVSVLVGIAVLVWVALKTDLGEAGRVLGRVGEPCILALLAMGCCMLFAQSVGWQWLLRGQGWKVPLRSTLGVMLMAFSVNYVVPSMNLAGEPLRAQVIAKRFQVRTPLVAATVLVHKLAEFTAFIVLMVASTGVMLWSFALDRRLQIAIVIAVSILVALFATLFIGVGLRWPLASGLVSLGGDLFPIRRAAGLRRMLRDVETAMSEATRGRPIPFALSVLSTGSAIVLNFLKPLVFFSFLNRTLPLGELTLLFVFSQLLLMLQFTPAGIGMFEGGLVAVFALIGLEAPEAVAYAVAQRMADLVLVIAGTLLATRYGFSGFFAPKALPSDVSDDSRAPRGESNAPGPS